MKILINAVSAVAGGGITYLTNLLKYLPDIMPEDEFLVVIQGITLPDELYTKKNLTIRKISDKTSSENIIKRYWWENTGLIKLCKLWKADILYCIANMTPIVPTGIKTIVMIQNVAPLTIKVLFYLLKYEGLKAFLKMFANSILTIIASLKSDKTIVLSNATKKLLLSIVSYPKASIVYHGINCNNFKPNEKIPIITNNEPYFLFVSNIYVYKGLEYIIKAYETNPNLPKIFIAGFPYDAKYYSKIQSTINKKKLENKIFFLSAVPHEELPGWYSNAIAMVYTSWCENCPNILLEAQSCGCPIIAMKIGPMPEFCSSENILVESFDGKAIADAMEKAIELRKDKNLPQRLSEYAKKYTWQKAMEIHKKILEE